MTMSDPIADMLTRIRNANTAKHDTVDVPSSKMKLAPEKTGMTAMQYIRSERQLSVGAPSCLQRMDFYNS